MGPRVTGGVGNVDGLHQELVGGRAKPGHANETTRKFTPSCPGLARAPTNFGVQNAA